MKACFGGSKKHGKVKNETAFKTNGSMLLEKLIASCDGRCNPIRNFSEEELKGATNNYDSQLIVLDDGFFIMYKGILQDRHVIVKKYKHETNALEFSFNDIVFASQMSVHKNVLKLIGCCLETRIPALVFESAEKGRLSDWIYNPDRAHMQPLKWKHRLKIAVEVANAIAYLHTAFSRPVVHRNLRPATIFLDNENTPKLSDFSMSIAIPAGESHIRDNLMGTIGFLAPEYHAQGKFNEKADVFGFGATLLTLLAGKSPYDPSFLEEGSTFSSEVKKCLESKMLDQIVDPIISEEGPWQGKEQQLQTFAMLYLQCAAHSEDDRPAIIDVAKQLKEIYQSAVPF